MGFAIPLVLCCLFHVSVTSSNGGHYIMIVPTVMHENSLMTIGVSTIDFENDEQFQIKLSGINGETELELANSIHGSNTVLLQSKIRSLENGPYQLTASTPGKNERIEILVKRRPVIILIQTDKPIYKPGDTIKFRVLVLDHKTRPLKDLKKIQVQLRDSNGNLIREWPYASLQQGVFQSQLDLANFIPIGDWTLTVFALQKEKKQKSITIAEYVLPTHEIQIKSSKRLMFKHQFMEVIIDARYTFGKPVNGNLSVTFNDTDYSHNSEINGRSVIRVALSDIVDLDYPDDIFWLEVNVKIEEYGSGHIYEAGDTIPIYKRPHKIELRKSSEYLLSEESFRCWLTLTDPDGIPLANPGTVHVEVTRSTQSLRNQENTYNAIPDVNGDVSLMLDSSGDTEKIELEVQYDGEVTKFQILREVDADEEDKMFFKTSLLTGRPKLNESVEALVQSSFHMNLVLFYVISQGEIMANGRVNVENKRSVTLAFKVNSAMIPEASLVVFAIHESKLWKDIVRFKVLDLNNNVSIKLSINNLEPGDEIGITVSSQPGSMIGLLAIDRGMLQLGQGNDITKNLVLEELRAPRANEDDLESLGFTVLSNAEEASAFQSDIRFREEATSFPSTGPAVKDVRKKFPETWLWMAMAPVNASGMLQINQIVPDSITGWSIRAFSINNDSGVGVIDYPVSLNVLKSFFITVNLPYSIVKTETAIVEVFVHNYLNDEQEVTVTIINDQGDFQFVDDKNETNSHSVESQQGTVASNSVSKVTFMIKPTRSGNIIFIITAECEVARDAVQHSLRVTPPGLLVVRNDARFIEVEESSINFSIRLDIPRETSSGSVNITFSAEGILLGAALTNLDQLIRLPTGCGEQNMMKLVPSVIALEYMSKKGTLTKSTETRAIDYLRKGYQNQLRYKLSDGSFSVFGKRDGRGSVFLTALTARTLRFAAKYIDVDRDVIKNSFDWLRSKQQGNGQFIETGKVFFKKMQGGLGDGTTLTAYVLIALLEHKLAGKYQSVVNKGVDYIVSQKSTLTSPYDLALVSYVLHLANHPLKGSFIDKLIESSQSDGDLRWWGSAPTSIETTAYALLTYMGMEGMTADEYSIMKWLVSQRYDKGGYDNTQNTYVGLQALSQLAQKMSISRNDYHITVDYEGGQHQLHMNPQSSLNGLQVTLPPSVRRVDTKIEGTGVGVFQIAYQYNLVAHYTEPRFKIEKIIQNQRSGVILNVCCSVQSDEASEETNMLMMEVSLPSGYAVAHSTVKMLNRIVKVRKIETKDDDTHLILYMDRLLVNDSVCVDFEAFERAKVLTPDSGWIKVYDYYDPTRDALEYFDIPKRRIRRKHRIKERGNFNRIPTRVRTTKKPWWKFFG